MDPPCVVIKRESGLSAQDLDRFRTSLEQRRRQKVDAIDALNRQRQEEAVEDETTMSHSPVLERERAEYAELARINEALRRMIDGSYGICEDCGRAIGQDRLDAGPTCILCQECQERAEAA